MAQTTEKKYDSLWKKVEDLANKKGLTKSALIEVDKIYQLAKKEKKDAQIIKALLYRMNLNENFDEGHASITTLEKEKQALSEPILSILNSLLAEKYLNYFQQARDKLYDRTATGIFKDDDIGTWSINDFHKKITTLYVASIQSKKLLQQTKLGPFEAIIVKGNSRNLRPTLYDLLAHRALDYFRNDEPDINRPAYAFQIKDDKLFLPAEAFIKHSITTSDSLSLHHKALLICQELLSFHAADPTADALIDADIIRMEIVYQFGVMENKEGLYSTALNQLYRKYPLQPAAAKAAGLLAQWHVNRASAYDPLSDPANRFEYLEALKICETIVQQKQESEGRSNCLVLINNIKRKELNLQTEKVNVPNQPFRTLVSFKNFTQLYFRLISVNAELQKKLSNQYQENYWKQLVSLPSIRNWNQAFPATNDYQKHSAEIKIDALPVGSYVLLASVNENYSLDLNPIAMQLFFVSNISYINNANSYFVLDRDNGKPLANAAVQLWNNRYDPASRKNIFVKGEKFKTSDNGFFQVGTKKNPTENFQLEIHYQSDQLFLNDYFYQTYREENVTVNGVNSAEFERRQASVFFFTDRSIYRPGQTAYFKGIAITKDAETGKTKIYSNQKAIVILYNANGEPVDSLQLITNDFGSYSGKFKLPEHMLNGEFQLRQKDVQGTVSFSVEEYKRPKFYADFEKLRNTYKINDSISVTGFAKAYAGNNIDGATVTFRVVRKARFIHPWLYRKIGIPLAGNMEITHGIATTTSEGKFTIQFKAIPDLTIDRKLDPVFDFQVIADITDINGETRTAETTIAVSYKSLQLKVTLSSEETVAVDSFNNISIITQNMNGEFAAATVRVSVYRLRSPERLIRKRFWQQPDMYVISKETYAQLFPYDEYGDETNPQTWVKTEKLYERTAATNANASFEIAPKGLTTGWYSVEVVTKDAFGEEVKDVRNIQLYDGNNIPAAIFSWNIQKNQSVEPGDKSTISIISPVKDLFVIQQVERQTAIQHLKNNTIDNGNQPPGNYTFISVSNEKKSFDFPVTEDDRGGFGVYHFFVKNNRFYFFNDLVPVPWTNKDLTINYESFRDKTIPGSEEKWKLKLSGYKNEKVVAEMLVSMYDASLDQFKIHSWNKPNIWPIFKEDTHWNGRNSFSAIQSMETYNEEESNIKFYSNVYDQVISLPDRNNLMIRGLRAASSGIGANDMVFSRVEEAKASSPGIVNNAGIRYFDTAIIKTDKPGKNPGPPTVQTRKNFNETAFFLPLLETDSAGNISFGFTIPEALTRWKFQALAYTKNAAFGYSTKDVTTQKQLMVQPNTPRFLREGDHMELSTKIVNMSDKEITGTVHLELLNAADMQPVDGWFQNMTANQYFTAEPGKSVVANFNIQIPYQYNGAVVYRFVAKSDSAGATDGEEASLPVLTNSMLVTESVPLSVHGSTTKKFRFEKLLGSGASETLQQHSLTVEFSSNPAWYAVQALPFLIEYPYECSEQAFNHFYANALATKIANASPRIKTIFEKWKSSSKDGSLLSNLEKNPELKAVLLEETPWVLEAKSESQQQKNIALLFEMVSMNGFLQASIFKLQQSQSPNGGFPWFKGGPDDRFITQYILTGLGHLKKLNALPASNILDNIISQGIAYLDKRLKEDYDILLKSKSKLDNNNISYPQLQYLYMRSFFSKYGIPGETVNAANYYRKQSQRFWLQQNVYMQGMTALALNRSGDYKTASDILKSLKQHAIVSEDMGVHWKDNLSGYFWYQAPVETQSLLMEAFSEIGNDNKTIDGLKTWLIRQKQTQRWSSTKATADACYALLLQGTDWLSNDPAVEIKLGNKTVKSSGEEQQAGTGYFKTIFTGPFVNPMMGDISVTVSPAPPGAAPSSNAGGSWGAVYWQYFERLDKITPASTPLQLVKKLFREKQSDRGPVLVPITDGASIKVGDKVKVRIELRVDRDMEYVHLKDLRAACMEPVNVLSAYKYQGGLGYYESTKDASTNFFFNWLPKGVYVFEYPLFATQAGNFSNGVSSIQCMYAPEFSSHSEGVRLHVE